MFCLLECLNSTFVARKGQPKKRLENVHHSQRCLLPLSPFLLLGGWGVKDAARVPCSCSISRGGSERKRPREKVDGTGTEWLSVESRTIEDPNLRKISASAVTYSAPTISCEAPRARGVCVRLTVQPTPYPPSGQFPGSGINRSCPVDIPSWGSAHRAFGGGVDVMALARCPSSYYSLLIILFDRETPCPSSGKPLGLLPGSTRPPSLAPISSPPWG
ncbi:hypothetical protein BX600DRAFT_185292 [Xylariales sp. PMI_506]|nr:hypothetical protein BX600DRAFT_185292 [Xylariales sp. PMI_506]